MTVLYLKALAAMAASLSVLMAGAWIVQQRTGNSGWVDTIWTFSLGLVGVGSALWPLEGAPHNARQWLVEISTCGTEPAKSLYPCEAIAGGADSRRAVRTTRWRRCRSTASSRGCGLALGASSAVTRSIPVGMTRFPDPVT